MDTEPKQSTSNEDNPRTAEPGEAVSGFPEPPGKDPGEGDREPHHALNNPVEDPDPTEWPDPYDKRPDPRGPGEGSTPTGATSTSEPHPAEDPEAPPPSGDR